MTQEVDRIEENHPAGLCARCRHGRRVPTPRAVYWLCERAATDAAYAKYPRLPVMECVGFEAKGEA